MSTIVTRAGKGSPLTWNEVDNNFTNLNTDKYQSGSNASFGTIAGTSITSSALTSGRITFASTGGLLADSANLTFNGTTLTTANDASINGLTVGKGGGAVSTNTASGVSALYSNTTGYYNTAIGAESLQANTTASYNTAVGYQSLSANTTGQFNVAIGRNALIANTTADENTAVGTSSLTSNTTGAQNVAVGRLALNGNTTGNYNVSVGKESLLNNTTASNNTAVGYQAGYSTTTGGVNAFFGDRAGYSATTGVGNTFIGQNAGYSVTTGVQNTFVGHNTDGSAAGSNVTTGSKNTILGGFNGNQGGLDIRTSSNHIVLSDGDGNPRGVFDSSGNWIVGGGAENGLGTFRNSSANKATLAALATNTSGSNYGIDSVSYATAGNTPALFRGFSGSSSPSQVWQVNGAGNIDLFGGQITFPATQNASSNANTLDDYEEGTWTPTVTGQGGGALTLTAYPAQYTKIGNIVHVFWEQITWTANSGLSSSVLIGGLPYASKSSGFRSSTGGFGGSTVGSLTFTGVLQPAMDANATYVWIIYRDPTNNTYSHTPTFAASGTIYGFSFTYETNT